MKKSFLALLMGLGAFSGYVSAYEDYVYVCTHGHEQREIEVIYLQRESRVPCEVRYVKAGREETVWSANYTLGYCEEKAAEFVKKQEGWGWRCQMMPLDIKVDDELTGE